METYWRQREKWATDMTSNFAISICQDIIMFNKDLIKRCNLFRIIGVSLTSLFGCSGNNESIVATAAGHELSIDQVVEVLARENTLPTQPQFIEALADFWIDYTLMGEISLEDSTLANLDLDLILRQQLEEELVNRYLESMVEFDTIFTRAELQEAWNEAPPSDSIRAAHILLEIPDSDDGFHVDSLVELATDLKRRIERGESFGNVARQYSDDAGSASNGGDLGFFLPGMLMPELEETAYNLQVGEVSEPFFSSSGVHLIRVLDRRAMDFQSSEPEFRQMMIERTIDETYSQFMNDLIQSKDIKIAIESASIVRELARNTEADLNRAALNRSLVDYIGGSLTVEEGLDFLRTLGRDLLDQVADVPEETLDQLLMDLTQSRILVDLAMTEEIQLTDPYLTHRDSLFVNFLEMLKTETDAIGIRMIREQEGETSHEALDRLSLQLIQDLIAGRNPPSFGQITVGVRKRLDWSIDTRAVAATLDRLSDLQGFSTEPSPGSPDENISDSTGVN